MTRGWVGTYFNKHTNTVLRYLTAADFVFYSATQLLGPIFAIFIVEFIPGGNAAVAGVAAAVYLVAKSAFQTPIGFIIDKISGERDDYLMMVGGTFVGGLLPLFFLVITSPFQLYVVQFFLGLAYAAIFPSFMGIFTRHVNDGKEASAWSFYYTFLDIGMALGAAVGGYFATVFGFHAVIIVSSLVSAASASIYLPIRSHMRQAPHPRHT